MRHSPSRRNLLVFLITTAAVIALDQVIKALVVGFLAPGESVQAIPHVLRITNLNNPGAAFGLLKGSGGVIFLSAIVIVVLSLVWFYRARHKKGLVSFIALGLMIGGAVSNLADRVFKGSVVDYLDFGWWPVFNAADVAIVCGVIIILVVMIVDLYRGEEYDGSRHEGLEQEVE